MHSDQHVPLIHRFVCRAKLLTSFFQDGVEQMQFAVVDGGKQMMQRVVAECGGDKKEALGLVGDVPGGIQLSQSPISVFPWTNILAKRSF